MSGPVALSGLRSLSSFSTPFGVTVIPSMLAYGLGPLSGMLAVSSYVNTDTNCRFRILAFTLASL